MSDSSPPWVTDPDLSGATLEDLNIDDSLPQLERVSLYVQSKIPLQRLVHTKLLSSTAIAAGFDVANSTLLPLLMPLAADPAVVVRQSLPEQIAAMAPFFVECGGVEGYNAFLEGLLVPLSRLVCDEREEVRQAASEALAQCASWIKPPDVGRHLLTVVLRLAHDDDDDGRRVTAAWLLSELSAVLGSDLSHQFLIPELVSLAQDPKVRVRRHVAWVMRRIFSSLGGPQRLLDEYLGLTEDDSYRVRRACTEAFADMAVPLSAEVRGTVLLNAYSRLLQDSNKHVRTGAYLHLGPFMATLKSSQVSMGMVQSFCGMADEEELKLQAAFQVPSVVLTIGRGRWFELRECYLSLCRSENPKVRRTLACSLHEVARILGSELCENDLLPVFESFANDEDAVRSGITAHLAQFLQSLRPDLVRPYLPLVGDLLGKAASMDWRARELIARQIDGLARLLNPEAAEAVLVPIVFDLLRDNVAQVRKIAVDAIPSLLRALSSEANPKIQADLVAKLHAFATSEFFQERQTFVQFSAGIFALEPEESALATGFLRLFESLATDPVADVRISVKKVAAALPLWIQAAENGRKFIELR